MRKASAQFFDWKVAAFVCVLVLGAATVGFSQGTGEPAAAALVNSGPGHVIGVAFEGRMVGDLDKSVAFYKALGFVPAEGVNSSWRSDEVMNRIHGTKGVESRMAKFTLNSNISGKPFTLYLREFRGIPRKNAASGNAWDPGMSHIDLTVPDVDLMWSQLKAAGMLRPRTWDGKLVAVPGETKGSMAYIQDPDGMDVEIVNQRAAAPATPTQPARPADPPGFNHIGLVILDAEKAQAFYGGLLGERWPANPMTWASGDFLDSAIGGHGNILRIVNGTFAEAADPAARMRFEIVEFQNRKKAVAPYSITDIGVSYMGLEVSDLDRLFARLKGAGVTIVSDGIVTMTGGYRVAMVRDLDTGAFVELFERPKQ